MNLKKLSTTLYLIAFFLVAQPQSLFAMHIMEGFLQPVWAGLYWILIIPFLFYGLKRIKTISLSDGKIKLLIAIAGAFVFVLSALKLPSFTGSSSHPTGVALGAILFGPSVMFIIGFIVLLFQALLLAHGGITTLGANTISMAIAGSVVAWSIWKLGNKLGINKTFTIFLAAFIGNITIYTVTSVELALAHPDSVSGFSGALVKFLTVFAITQIPIAAIEALLTVVVFNILTRHAYDELKIFRKSIS